MSDEQTLSMDEGVESVSTAENLSEEEQDSLRVGEQIEAEQEPLLAGKYKDPKDLEKAYTELQKKLGEKSEEVSQEEESDPEVEPPQPSDNILDQLWTEGLNNSLTKETFDKIKEMDPVDVAKLAMQARQAAENNPSVREFTDQDVEQIHGLVGGPESYNRMMSWAQENVPDQEITMYDKVMELGNPIAAYFAVQAMSLRYADVVGRDAPMVTGKAPKSTSNVFNSQAEMVRAMEDSRYEDDPAYREQIMQKLQRSNINF